MKGVQDVHDRPSKSKRVAFFVLILLSASISGCLEDDSRKHNDRLSETEYESHDENESDLNFINEFQKKDNRISVIKNIKQIGAGESRN